MTVLTFDVTVFRAMFTRYSDETTYPTVMLEMFWSDATCYISDADYGRLNGACRQKALYLMTAHLVFSNDLINAGQTSVLVTGSTIGSVSVSLQPPPQTDQFSWWLNTTPYGQQLDALLSIRSVGGIYLGGSSERKGFRKIGGSF